MVTEFHCHSNYSDGSSDVKKIVDICVDRGVACLSVTDHDTFSGSDAAKKMCSDTGVLYIDGAEISCFDYKRKQKVHLLCYEADDRKLLEESFEKMHEIRLEAGIKMLSKVSKIYPIDKALLYNIKSKTEIIFKQHIMYTLKSQGLVGSMFGEEFKKMFDPKSGTCYEEIRYPDVFDMANIIKKSGGKCVMAHPGNYSGMDVMEELASGGYLDGVEYNHPKNSPDQKMKIRETAQKNSLVLTGGSDYHGEYSTRKYIPGDFSMDEQETKKFLDLLYK